MSDNSPSSPPGGDQVLNGEGFQVELSSVIDNLMQSTINNVGIPSINQFSPRRRHRNTARVDQEGDNASNDNTVGERENEERNQEGSPNVPTNIQATVNNAAWRADILHLWETLTSVTDGSGKFVIPILILVALKNLVGNIQYIIFLMLAVTARKELNQFLSIQISSKGRCNFLKLAQILASAILIMTIVVLYIDSLGYTDDLPDRLTLSSVHFFSDSNSTLRGNLVSSIGINSNIDIRTSTENSIYGLDLNFFSLFWNCAITDLVVRLASVAVRAFLCFVVGLRRVNAGTIYSDMQWVYKEIQRGLTRFAGPPSLSTGHHHDSDLEAASPLISSSVATSATTTSISINGLVARRLHQHATSGQMEANPDNSSTRVPSGNDDSTVDSEHCERVYSEDYLLKLRLCTLIDGALYCYRCLLPVPPWYAYFGSGSPFPNRIFGSIYLLIKLIDVSWKFGGVIKGIDHFYHRKLVWNCYHFCCILIDRLITFLFYFLIGFRSLFNSRRNAQSQCHRLPDLF